MENKGREGRRRIDITQALIRPRADEQEAQVLLYPQCTFLFHLVTVVVVAQLLELSLSYIEAKKVGC